MSNIFTLTEEQKAGKYYPYRYYTDLLVALKEAAHNGQALLALQLLVPVLEILEEHLDNLGGLEDETESSTAPSRKVVKNPKSKPLPKEETAETNE